MYRQGDVLIVPVEKPYTNRPEYAVELSHKVVAHGELTGHSHQFPENSNVKLIEMQGSLYLGVFESSPLMHEEHETIIIPEGTYRVIRQREFDDTQDARYVRD